MLNGYPWISMDTHIHVSLHFLALLMKKAPKLLFLAHDFDIFASRSRKRHLNAESGPSLAFQSDARCEFSSYLVQLLVDILDIIARFAHTCLIGGTVRLSVSCRLNLFV